MKNFCSLLFILLFWNSATICTGQSIQKTLEAKRIHQTMVIDGIFDESGWLIAESATDFIQEDPSPGDFPAQPTTVWVLYDDQAIYIGARLHDDNPHLIESELSERNVIGNTDYFEVVIDPYRDGINGYSFVLTASGVQRDARIYNNNRDAAWDAVWESAVTIDSTGWNIELRIPYTAIRFPKSSIQDWNINFGRNIRRYREQSWWNEVNPTITGFLAQSGSLKNLTDIKPPLRLSLYPFLALSKEFNDYTGQNPYGINGGMDLKLGVGQAFTLDMTLIPDFSQTQSDRDYLNLGPFELVFDENRPFFTEGMELFKRGNIFHSRRIGGNSRYFFPVHAQLADGENIDFIPQTSKLINATKLSGRTGFGTGIGMLNAITGPAYAKVTGPDSSRMILAIPFTNYNVIVADQSLKNNSNIAIINTNVQRLDRAPASNVTGTDFQIYNPGRIYSIRGYGHYSINNPADLKPKTGYQYQLELAKVSGTYRGGMRYRAISDEFDPNDMGLLFINNERSTSVNFGYYMYEPNEVFNRFNTTLQVTESRLFTSNDNTGFRINWTANASLRTWEFLWVTFQVDPIQTKDFFEPRTGDFKRYYLRPSRAYGNIYYSSDYRKKFAVDLRLEGTMFPSEPNLIYAWTIQPRVRFSDRFSMMATSRTTVFKKDLGFVRPVQNAIGFELLKAEDIVFGMRNRRNFENSIRVKYIFTNRMNVSLAGRHFYSKLDYQKFFTLKEDGTLNPSHYMGRANQDAITFHDLTFHIFTLDLIYTWRFAPGSDLIFIWKNNILSGRNEVPETYLREFRNLIHGPQENTFVIKAIYYLDYQRLFL